MILSPTQNAVRGYVNRRLGWDHNGPPVNNVIGGGTVHETDMRQ